MRQKAGAELSKEVNGELESLGLRQGGFNIVISPTQEMGLRGKDKASFEICMNKGGKFPPDEGSCLGRRELTSDPRS
jgi:DNA repair ATPase RecN